MAKASKKVGKLAPVKVSGKKASKTVEDKLEEKTQECRSLERANDTLCSVSGLLSQRLADAVSEGKQHFAAAKAFAGMLGDIEDGILCLQIRLSAFSHAVCNVNLSDRSFDNQPKIDWNSIPDRIPGDVAVRFLIQVATELGELRKMLDHENHVKHSPAEEVNQDVEQPKQ